MSHQTVVISQCAKLDLRMNHMVIRTSGKVQQLFIEDIDVLIIESTQVSFTSALIVALIEAKVRVVFCDSKHNPCSELLPYHGRHDCNLRLRSQIAWSEDIKKTLWTEIVRHKIQNQIVVLKTLGKEGEYLDQLELYLSQLEFDDKTNREAMAARSYFNALYGVTFTRETAGYVNSFLNYAYQVLMSMFAREIKACGCLTELGIHHQNQHNFFNLASDLMEPFRPVVDLMLHGLDINKFEKEEKYALIQAFERTVLIKNRKEEIKRVISIYTKSAIDALDNQNLSLVRWPTYE